MYSTRKRRSRIRTQVLDSSTHLSQAGDLHFLCAFFPNFPRVGKEAHGFGLQFLKKKKKFAPDRYLFVCFQCTLLKDFLNLISHLFLQLFVCVCYRMFRFQELFLAPHSLIAQIDAVITGDGIVCLCEFSWLLDCLHFLCCRYFFGGGEGRCALLFHVEHCSHTSEGLQLAVYISYEVLNEKRSVCCDH